MEYNDDDVFELMRSEALSYYNNLFKKIIKSWCNEANYNQPVSYTNNFTNCTITLYTKSPGALIGLRGSLVDKYTNIFNKHFHTKFSIKFIQVDNTIIV